MYKVCSEDKLSHSKEVLDLNCWYLFMTKQIKNPDCILLS